MPKVPVFDSYGNIVTVPSISPPGASWDALIKQATWLKKSFGPMNAIKLVRLQTGASLQDAKNFVTSLDSPSGLDFPTVFPQYANPAEAAIFLQLKGYVSSEASSEKSKEIDPKIEFFDWDELLKQVKWFIKKNKGNLVEARDHVLYATGCAVYSANDYVIALNNGSESPPKPPINLSKIKKAESKMPPEYYELGDFIADSADFRPGLLKLVREYRPDLPADDLHKWAKKVLGELVNL